MVLLNLSYQPIIIAQWIKLRFANRRSRVQIYYIKFLKIKIFYSKLHIFAPYIIPTYNNLVNFSIFENLFQGVVNHPDLKLNLYAVYFFYSFWQSCMVLEKISYKLSTLNSYQNWNI